MGTIVSVLVGGSATILFWRADLMIGVWASILATIVALWSAGIMHNHATERAFSRHQRFRQLRVNQGATAEELAKLDIKTVHLTPEDIESVPGSITRVNLAANIAVVALLAWSLFSSFN